MDSFERATACLCQASRLAPQDRALVHILPSLLFGLRATDPVHLCRRYRRGVERCRTEATFRPAGGQSRSPGSAQTSVMSRVLGFRPINRDLLQDFRCPFQADITVESVCFVLMPQQNSNDWIEQVGAGPFRGRTLSPKRPRWKKDFSVSSTRGQFPYRRRLHGRTD